MVARLVLDALWRNRWIYVVGSVILVSLCGSCTWPVASIVGDQHDGPLAHLRGGAGAHGRHRDDGSAGASSLAGHQSRSLAHDVGRRDRRPNWTPAGHEDDQRTPGGGVRRQPEGVRSKRCCSRPCTTSPGRARCFRCLPLLGYCGFAVARSGAVAASLTPAGSTVAMLACFGLPILVSGALPTHVGEFTSVTTGVLIACLAIAFGALAWTPQRGVLAGERAQARRTAASGSRHSEAGRSPDWNLEGGRSAPAGDARGASRRVSRAGILRRHLWISAPGGSCRKHRRCSTRRTSAIAD